jgi:beta-glucosidase
VRFLAGDGTVLATEERPGCTFDWPGSSFDDPSVARVEVRAVIRAIDAGTYTIAGSGVGRYWLSVGGEEVFDGRLELPPGADVAEGMMIPPQAAHSVHLERGEAVKVVLAHEVGSNQSDLGDLGVRFQLNLEPPHGTDDEEIERAVFLAGDADLAVVVVGTTDEVESEGFDRASLSLPGRQDELVRRVADANPRTVVVVNAGAPVLLPWADEVAAVLLAWFPGQEFGNALADVLLGLAEPGGRLPTTWPEAEDGLPSVRPVDGILAYDEGLFIGYRAYDRDGRRPLYPFGHGLGYSTWTYVSIDAPRDCEPGADVAVTVGVRNSGIRRGREIIQLYASRPGSSVERPVQWLVGFATVDANAGEGATATITVPPRAFEHWDVDAHRWAIEPGAFQFAAGSSSAVLPVSTEIAVLAGNRAPASPSHTRSRQPSSEPADA